SPSLPRPELSGNKTNDPERAVLSALTNTFTRPWHAQREGNSPAISHRSRAPDRPHPGRRGGGRAQALPGIFGVSLRGRRPILSPSQTSGSYFRPATRSFSGISALSV